LGKEGATPLEKAVAEYAKGKVSVHAMAVKYGVSESDIHKGYAELRAKNLPLTIDNR